MDKRYQIFVSSTYEDLKEERKAVIESILQMKHMPAGMELFSASNDKQFKYIKKIIDNCDYYVLIIAGRYGSINPETGKSYTELEYDYAVEREIPILVFFHSDIENLSPDNRDKDQEKLNQFREKASKNRLCKPWNNILGLQSSVITSLHQEFDENPQIGWVRGGKFDNTELLDQINQLRIEKDELKKENAQLIKKIREYNTDIENIANFDEEFIITGKQSHYERGSNWYSNFEVKLTWEKIFSLIAPFLISPQNYSTFYSKLVRAIEQEMHIKDLTIYTDCVQTIKIHFLTANLIKVYSANTINNGGVAEFIQLTEKGLQYLKQIKSVKSQKSTIPTQQLLQNLMGIPNE